MRGPQRPGLGLVHVAFSVSTDAESNLTAVDFARAGLTLPEDLAASQEEDG